MKKENVKMNKFDKSEKKIEDARKTTTILSALAVLGGLAWKVIKEVGKAATKL